MLGQEVQNTKVVEEESDEGIQENLFLTFNVSHEVYGVNILQIVEIIRLLKITEIPETPNFIKGVINLRGKIIPVMDIRLRFGIVAKEYDDRTCIIVASIKDVEMGLIVDSVAEVVEIPPSYVEEMPQMSKNSHQRFIKGIGKINEEVKILLDLEKLLVEELTV
ncbi:MAG: chemotaxis protein CheW [Pseudomonadota bacterium]